MRFACMVLARSIVITFILLEGWIRVGAAKQARTRRCKRVWLRSRIPSTISKGRFQLVLVRQAVGVTPLRQLRFHRFRSYRHPKPIQTESPATRFIVSAERMSRWTEGQRH